MNAFRRFTPVLSIFLGLLFPAPASASAGKTPASGPGVDAPQAAALAAYLPAGDAAGKWTREGTADFYGAQDLYLYIDGGAEIYREYGIVQTAVQEYRGPGGKSVSLEIFRMTDGNAGYGIYRFKTSAEGRAVPLGEEGRLEGYYLNFRKGPFLVTLTGADEAEVNVRGILALGAAVDRLLPPPERPSRPSLMEALPRADLQDSSLKYFRGPLGLFNLRPFATRDIFRFREGCRGGYPGGIDLFLLAYETPASCLEHAQEAVRALAESGYRLLEGREGSFLFEDPKKAPLFVQARGGLLFLVCGADPEKARRLIAAAPGR